MAIHKTKTNEDKSQSALDKLSQQPDSRKSGLKLEDNRPQALAQRKLQEVVQNRATEKTSVSQSQKTDTAPIQKKENSTGLPDNLKSGIENLSGYSMDDVRVHYNSDKPAQLQAHAYAQGTNIHIASGQEKHLAHEAWHVVQQKQGRVKPTVQLKEKIAVNDSASLEKEADVMGSQALKMAEPFAGQSTPSALQQGSQNSTPTLQGAFVYKILFKKIVEDQRPDSYYKGIGYIAIPASDGKIIWCDKGKADAVKEEIEAGNLKIALPEDAEKIQEIGTNVEQDGLRQGNRADQEYYYTGQGVAWTTRIRTCTALALHDEITGLSFLCHADGGDGNKERIVQHLKSFLNAVPDQEYGSTLSINIFTASDTDRDSGESLKVVIQSLGAVKLPWDRITHVGPEDTVAVFAGGPAKHLRPSDELVAEAIEAYNKKQSEAGKQYIISMLRAKPYLTGVRNVYQELYLCYRSLKAEKKECAFLEQYLSPEDIRAAQSEEKKHVVEKKPEDQQASQSSTAIPSFKPSDPKKKWADYSSDED